MRSKLTNIMLNINGGTPSWTFARKHYSEWFDEFRDFGDWGSSSQDYRRLRLVVRQYEAIRGQIHSIDTFAGLEEWLENNSLACQLVPQNLLDKSRKLHEFRKVQISNVVEEPEVDSIMYEGMEEEITGPGWSFDLLITIKQGFKYKTVKSGLIGMGIYVNNAYYSHDEDKRPAYLFECSILNRDFNMTDAADERWKKKDEDEEEGWIDTMYLDMGEDNA